jgi:hypothetical protein
VAQEAADRLGVLLERHQLDTPLHATALLLEVLGQEPLRDPLLDTDRERIGRVEVLESFRAQLASFGGQRPDLAKRLTLAQPPLDDPESLEAGISEMDRFPPPWRRPPRRPSRRSVRSSCPARRRKPFSPRL